MNHLFLFFPYLVLMMTPPALANDWPPKSWTQPAKPCHIAGPVYYVGSRELTAYLLVDKAGLVLINVGMEENVPAVLKSIRDLGFDPNDIRYLLITQAHFDHGGGAALIREKTGAEVLVGKADVALMRSGGLKDYVFGDKLPFQPLSQVRGLVDGEWVVCGDLRLKTLDSGGHTPGSSSWLLEAPVEDEGSSVFLFQASLSILEPETLIGNHRYPHAAQDFETTIRKLAAVKADRILPDHVVFAHPEGITHQDPIDPAWFKNQAILTKQLERARKRLKLAHEAASN